MENDDVPCSMQMPKIDDNIDNVKSNEMHNLKDKSF